MKNRERNENCFAAVKKCPLQDTKTGEKHQI